jgi:hypothetical protein
MKFWMSGEIDVDLNGSEKVARKKIEPVMNELLSGASVDNVERWSFIAIILSEKFLDGVPEIVRKNNRRKELEFRLHISHGEFKESDEQHRISMMLDAVERSIGLMDSLKVSDSNKEIFLDAVNGARRKLLG